MYFCVHTGDMVKKREKTILLYTRGDLHTCNIYIMYTR